MKQQGIKPTIQSIKARRLELQRCANVGGHQFQETKPQNSAHLAMPIHQNATQGTPHFPK